MWIVYIRDGDVMIEEVLRETPQNYYMRHSYSAKHTRLSKKTVFKLFNEQDDAYAFYTFFYKIWELKRHKYLSESQALKEEGLKLISKSSKILRDFDKDALTRLPKEYPEEFI